MNKEEIEKQFLKKYGCNTLFEFVDICLDFDTALYLIDDYFEKQAQLDIANKKLDKIREYCKNKNDELTMIGIPFIETEFSHILSIIGDKDEK